MGPLTYMGMLQSNPGMSSCGASTSFEAVAVHCSFDLPARSCLVEGLLNSKHIYELYIYINYVVNYHSTNQHNSIMYIYIYIICPHALYLQAVYCWWSACTVCMLSMGWCDSVFVVAVAKNAEFVLLLPPFEHSLEPRWKKPWSSWHRTLSFKRIQLAWGRS